MRILITGCAGFIGYNLTKKVLALGHEVIGIDDISNEENNAIIKNTRIEDLKAYKNFDFIKMDIVNDAFGSILRETKIDITIHLASKEIFYNQLDYIKYTPFLITNVIGTSKIYELSRAIGAKKFIFASTFSVYGTTKKESQTEKKILPRPISPVGTSKLAAEQVLHFMNNYYNIPTVILRVFSVYGPAMKPLTVIPLIIHRLKNNLPIDLANDPELTRDYIYVDDVVESIISTFDKRLKYQAINIATGISTNLKDLIYMIAEIMGVDKKNVKLVESSIDHRKVVVKKSSASTSRAEKMLKFKAKISLKEGLKKTVDWYLDNPDILEISTHK